MWSVGIRAQENDPQLETRLLRAAAGEESLGDLSEAEETLRDLMDQRPTSAGGLLALERVLRARGRHAEILPLTEVFVALEPDATSPRLVQLRVYAELREPPDRGLTDWAVATTARVPSTECQLFGTANPVRREPRRPRQPGSREPIAQRPARGGHPDVHAGTQGVRLTHQFAIGGDPSTLEVFWDTWPCGRLCCGPHGGGCETR